MSTDVNVYPRREKFFSQRFHRLMTKLCLAQEIGSLGCYLLSVIVSQEDACRYRKAVTYYDTQLMPLLGCRSKSQFMKVKKTVVASGWLHCETGRKGVPSKYWVCVPAIYKEVEDSPVCETDSDLGTQREPDEGQIETGSGADEGQIETGSGADEGHSLPYTTFPIPCSLSPSEIEKEAAAMAVELWNSIPGTSRPLLGDLTPNIKAKLDWLAANGRNESEHIWACIRDPTRDPTKVRTINQMWKFWQDCGLEETSNGRQRNTNTAPGGGRREGLEAPSL